MRRLFVCLVILLSLCASTARAHSNDTSGTANLPDSIAQYLAESDRWSSYEVTGWANPDHQADGFVALHKKGDNELLCFTLKDGAWCYAWHNDDALPDNDMPFLLGDATGSSDLFTDQVYDKPCLLSYYVLDGELCDFSCIWEKHNGSWQLVVYSMFEPSELYVHVNARELAFYSSDAQQYPDVVKGIIERNLRYINADTLPTSVAKAEKKLSLPPEIPQGELEAERIQFTSGKKYKVYDGPGEHFGQAGNGKAMVSTNDWIQVFGRLDDWIMIQYDITSERMRIGWISAAALPPKAQVPELAFHMQQATVIVDGASVTDDPLFSRITVALLPLEETVTVLSTMGEWSYVQVYSSVDPLYGFVKSSMLQVETAQERAARQGSHALTEVYGYSQKEVDTQFVFTWEINGDEFVIHMYPQAHPSWMYEAVFNLHTGKHIRSYSPFTTDYPDYPGEGTFRYTMDMAIAEGWLYNWQWEDRALLRQWLIRWEQPMTAALSAGLDGTSMSPMQAVTELFLASYGPVEGWPQPLQEWHDLVLKNVEENYQGNG